MNIEVARDHMKGKKIILCTVKTLSTHGLFGSRYWGLCVPRDSDDRVSIGPVSLIGDVQRNTEDAMHPGSDP